MIADCVIYGIGAGSGHSVRALTIKRLIEQLGLSCTAIIRKLPHGFKPSNSVIEFDRPELPSELALGSPLLIVDTFPSGWNDELTPSVLSRFRHSILVARYHRTLCSESAWRAITSRFHSVFLPYPGHHCEWTEIPARGRPIGYCLRMNPPRWESVGNNLLVLDPERRCTGRFFKLVQRYAREAGMTCSLVTNFAPVNQAKKFLIIGAGYNTFYEALSSAADIRFIAVDKRFDDQARRARRSNRLVDSVDSLRLWLSERDSSVQPFVRHEDCCISLTGYL